MASDQFKGRFEPQINADEESQFDRLKVYIPWRKLSPYKETFRLSTSRLAFDTHAAKADPSFRP
jgi:hypothetical protein